MKTDCTEAAPVAPAAVIEPKPRQANSGAQQQVAMRQENRERFEATNDLEISESRVRIAFLFIAAAAFGVASTVMAGLTVAVYLGLLSRPFEPIDLPTMIGVVLLLALAVAFLGTAAVQVGQRLFYASGPVVFLTEEGFKDRRISPQRIPWAAILSVTKPLGRGAGNGFYLEVDPNFAATSPLSLSVLSRSLQAGNRLFGYRGLWIMAVTLESPFNRTLFDLTHERLRDSTASRGALSR